MLLANSVFPEVAAILLVSALAGAVAMRLRQPLIVAFVAVGVAVGPSALGIVKSEGDLELLAEIGVALLLFAVGLKLDLHLVRSLGRTVLVAGTAQLALTMGLGYPLALAFGLGGVAALYVALGLGLSSTIIVVKLLSDRRELDDLHGRLAVGVLIVQDLAVVVAIIAVNASDSAGGSSPLRELGLVALSAVAFLGGLAALMRWVLERLLHALARVPELLVLFGIAWAVALAAAGELLGLGTEVGAFLAGVSIASTPYREAIGARLVSVRDFLLLFFFINLGAQLDLGELAGQLAPALALSAVALVAKPLIVGVLLVRQGYTARLALASGMPLAQISEFSLILAAVGLSLEHLEDADVALLAAIALITIPASVYLLSAFDRAYALAGPLLERLEHSREGPSVDEHEVEADAIVFGLGRYGGAIADGLSERGLTVLGVDYDPEALAAAEARGVPVLYGDVESPELLHELPLARARWVISTVRRRDANLALLHGLEQEGYEGGVAVAAHRDEDAERLRGAGADRVLRPYEDAARSVVELAAGAAREA